MFPTEDQLSIELSIRKALGRYLLKKYYWNSSRLREIIEVFGESKYNVIHEIGSCVFIIAIRKSSKKIQFTCRDIEKAMKEKGIDINNVKDNDIDKVVKEVCDEMIGD